MITGKFDLKIDDIAAALSNECADEQAKFFNLFFKALRIDCETNYRFDQQLCFIDQQLDKRAKEAFTFLTFDDGK